MPNTKSALIRQQVLDKYLQKERGYSHQELLEKCNEALELRGDKPVTSLNTIRDDITEIVNSYQVSIESIRKGRNIRYRYKDRDFSIYERPLSDSDFEILNDAIQTLSLYQGRPTLEWLDDMQAHLLASTDRTTDERYIVGFEENPYLKGREFFQPLFNAIKNEQSLEITYKSFKQEKETTNVIHPYFLKQYNNRWFLFSLTDGVNRISNYALDRIVAIRESRKRYEPNNGRFDAEEYFRSIIGVTRPANVEVCQITLFVSKRLVPYISTKPIHRSQKVVSMNDEGVIIEINVIPNYELEQLILSFGDEIAVVAPSCFRDKIMQRLENSQKNYDRFNSSEPIMSAFAPEIDN